MDLRQFAALETVIGYRQPIPRDKSLSVIWPTGRVTRILRRRILVGLRVLSPSRCLQQRIHLAGFFPFGQFTAKLNDDFELNMSRKPSHKCETDTADVFAIDVQC